MKRTILAAIAIAGVAGAFAVPTLVSGNARRVDGSLAEQQQAETPYVAELKGSNEVPGPGDTDGTGAATVSFAAVDVNNTEVCFDLTYSGIAAPTMAHIHTGAAGVAGAVVVDFGVPTPNAFSGCVTVANTITDPILANPSAFYVNVHNADFTGGAIRGQLAIGAPPAGSPHFLASPLRAYDSRIAPATKAAAGETRTISLTHGVDSANGSFLAVPPGATAAIISLTATEVAGPGFITAYSAALTTAPATSNLNFVTTGTTVAVTTQVAVDDAGAIKLLIGPASTHVIVDVVGYLY
jgi:hypothetical protein